MRAEFKCMSHRTQMHELSHYQGKAALNEGSDDQHSVGPSCDSHVVQDCEGIQEHGDAGRNVDGGLWLCRRCVDESINRPE